jgi:hypothetical protein
MRIILTLHTVAFLKFFPFNVAICKPVSWKKLDSKFEYLNFDLSLISARNTGVILIGKQQPYRDTDYGLNEENSNTEKYNKYFWPVKHSYQK